MEWKGKIRKFKMGKWVNKRGRMFTGKTDEERKMKSLIKIKIKMYKHGSYHRI